MLLWPLHLPNATDLYHGGVSFDFWLSSAVGRSPYDKLHADISEQLYPEPVNKKILQKTFKAYAPQLQFGDAQLSFELYSRVSITPQTATRKRVRKEAGVMMGEMYPSSSER